MHAMSTTDMKTSPDDQCNELKHSMTPIWVCSTAGWQVHIIAQKQVQDFPRCKPTPACKSTSLLRSVDLGFKTGYTPVVSRRLPPPPRFSFDFYDIKKSTYNRENTTAG